MKANRNPLARALLVALLTLTGHAAVAAPDAAAMAPQTDATRKLYWHGQEAIGQGNFPAALQDFRQLERDLRQAKAEGVDGALYWQAYALDRLHRDDETRAIVARLAREFPQSRWLDDARELARASNAGEAARAARAEAVDAAREAREDAEQAAREAREDAEQDAREAREDAEEDARQAREDAREDREDGRRALSPRDEDAMMAIEALMAAGSPKATPALLRVLRGTYDDQVKSRAMFVLSQIDPKVADEALREILSGNGGPRLKREAIQMIAVSGDPIALARLKDIYRNSKDVALRRAALQGWMVTGHGEFIAEVARTETDPGLRRTAIQLLGALGDRKSLGALYGAMTDARAKRDVLQALGIAGDRETLARIAETETDESVQAEAIQALAVSGGKQVHESLAKAYRGAKSDRLRRAALQGFMMSGKGGTDQLVALYRAETDRKWKREILQAISITDGDRAIELIDQQIQ